MSVFTSRTIYRLADAGAALVLRWRRLGGVATAEEPTKPDLGNLRGEIVNFGSSYAAFCMCKRVKPADFSALLFAAGVPELTGKPQLRAFDACTDGYTVYQDGRRRRKL